MTRCRRLDCRLKHETQRSARHRARRGVMARPAARARGSTTTSRGAGPASSGEEGPYMDLYRPRDPKAYSTTTANVCSGAGDGLRTRYLDLGKVALYRVSYSRSARGRFYPASAWRLSDPDGHAAVGE